MASLRNMATALSGSPTMRTSPLDCASSPRRQPSADRPRHHVIKQDASPEDVAMPRITRTGTLFG
ncbi:hypothetical protein STRIP9103_05546 [Streptomyces ipomoeae 91-03]|uniref:Uncharacterized protein n=1 Tax=Streptomyces ipomoeae 91-03 TaxID=698759 RepID=L1KPX3_9ACTN|nr:hypothetical protein STRIP9103_05546 [Streptomyces ipomoeae 91-03]